MRTEVLKALSDVYTKYTLFNGKPDDFISWAFLDDRDLTEGGFELNPKAEHICLYVDEGTFYIYENDFTFFHNGGVRVDLENYTNLSEEWHFQLSTVNYIAGSFEYCDFLILNDYFNKIM